MKRLKKQQWFILILVGFSGQLAWMLENMYLNVYLYNELGGTPQDIAWMVALSAITATVTTLLMGSISDKMGKRKPLIVIGYLIWGVTVLGFSFIHPDFLGQFVPVVHVAGLSVFLLILWDCVMTFLGSSANDAAFNAWITDTTHRRERTRRISPGDPTSHGHVISVWPVRPVDSEWPMGYFLHHHWDLRFHYRFISTDLREGWRNRELTA